MTNPRIRVVIVDDEPLARERLRTLLHDDPGTEIAAEAGDTASAIAAIGSTRPDLVFLDVQMPGGSGFEVIGGIGANAMPCVIFVTAYDKYALRAFEVHALDYLLKPFGRDRFRQTLTHARAHLERRRAGDLGRSGVALRQRLGRRPRVSWCELGHA